MTLKRPQNRSGPSASLSPHPQITAHLNEAERAQFKEYAAIFGLDPASLLVLLLAREDRVGRLATLLSTDRPLPGARKSKVTIHKKDPTLRERVSAMAGRHGTSVSHACAVLIRAESDEKWLEKVITTRIESH